MVWIELHDIRLFAYHGVYEVEHKVGNMYQLFLMVGYQEGSISFDSLGSTINYEELFEIVKQRMALNTPLLEKICEGIIRRIRHQYPFISEVKISIYKLQAPIEHLEGKVGVTIHKVFNEK